MESLKPGIPIPLQDLDSSSSPHYKQGASLRVTGKLREYAVETAVAVIADGSAILKVDTQHLRDIHFRIGSMYQFIGELNIEPDKTDKPKQVIAFSLESARLEVIASKCVPAPATALVGFAPTPRDPS